MQAKEPDNTPVRDKKTLDKTWIGNRHSFANIGGWIVKGNPGQPLQESEYEQVRMAIEPPRNAISPLSVQKLKSGTCPCCGETVVEA
ncbi:MAG: hypothetical protein HYU30_00525 [Chloroflexi bacterium]|nr:hypothetical protein [Chloroflexota bacterium]